jgi:hypothetical protein
MKKIINGWHYISVYLAGATALIAIFGTGDTLQKLLLASIAVMFLHFFEEFGFPGGFPWMGVKVLLSSDEMDSSKWDCNNLNSMFGNWGFLFFIYILPVLFPNIRFLTLAAMLFNIAELVIHLILFNVKQKTLYNPGLVTAVFGLAPIACYYFMKIFDQHFYIWYDYIIAIICLVFIFWFSFRSPIYWKLGRMEGYSLTDQTAYGINNIRN